LFSASFSFPHPENCHIIFVFSHLFFPQPQKLSKDTFMLWIKSILILSLITLCVNCRCFICLPCSVPCFFLWHGFPFCLLSWTASHSMPLKFRIKGCFSLSYRPQISLKHVSSWYHRTCRVSPVFHRTQWGIQWDKGFPPLCLPILRDKCQVMVFLVALCATASPYSIRNATAIGTIAITHAFVTTRCLPVRCTNCSPHIIFT